MNTDTPVYDYFLKDHLGNTRLAFTTKPETETTTATLENENEDRKFLGYDDIRMVYSKLVDRTNDVTNADGHAMRLSGGKAEKIGLVRSLQLFPRDKVHMEVHGKYIHPDDVGQWAATVSSIINAIATAGVSGPMVIDGSAYSNGDNIQTIPYLLSSMILAS